MTPSHKQSKWGWPGRRIAFGLLAAWLLVGGTSCETPLFKDDLQAIQARGVLRVATRNNAACFFEGPHRLEGFEYDLASAFAQRLQVRMEPIVIDSDREMVSELLAGRVDLIAAGFVVTEDLKKHLAFGPVYNQIQYYVVGRQGGPRIKSPADLAGRPIWVMSGASPFQQIHLLKEAYPELSWLPISDYESEELLEMVWKGVIPLTLADSNALALNRRYYPELVFHFAVGEPQQVAWVVHPRNRRLLEALFDWFNGPATGELVERLKQHYFGHLETFDYVDITTFRQRLRNRLPRYRQLFEAAAEQNGLDWKLIAAQAYQESHWNPRAKSFTGVRGLMMLTRQTAREMGFKDRLDPHNSIVGGAKYLAELHRKIGSQVPEPDRVFMALAAYNIGWGHLEDARRLAEKLEKDPNHWPDVRGTLPLLRLKKFYRTLPHGYARGAEPVQYVDRIRTYHRIIDRWEGERLGRAASEETVVSAASPERGGP
jgi:membrane-bound lytic murein transglycosylase F